MQWKQFQVLLIKQNYNVGRNNYILLLITEIQCVLVDVWKYMVRHNAR